MAVTASTDLVSAHPKLQAQIAALAEQYNVPGVAVGIYSRGEEDYAFHGVTSIENPLEVNAETYFQIGSTSKTYTATAIMILVERGLVDLDAPVRKYIPELKLKDESVAKAVTVKHLLNHTGGWLGDVFNDTGDGDDFLAKYVALLADVPQVNPLGKIASYNNAAFQVAGRLIEKVTGKGYEAAMQELVLDPIGLKESFYFPTDMLTRRFAVGHVERKDKQILARPWQLPRSAHPAGGVLSTARDQIKYARFHLGDGSGEDAALLLSRESLDLMQEPTAELKGGALGDFVGLSWLLRDVDDVRIVAHGGTTHGQLSAFDIVPARDFAVTVLTNSDSGGFLHRDAVKWILAEYLGIVEPEDEVLESSGEDLGVYAGDYDAVLQILKLTVDGDHLVALAEPTDAGREQMRAVYGDEMPEPKPLSLKPVKGDRLMVSEGDAKGMKVLVVRDESGRPVSLNLGGRIAHRVE